MHDYIIIGAGMAGLKLALAMMEDAFFSGKKVLILDESDKMKNDKTWCYWERSETRGERGGEWGAGRDERGERIGDRREGESLKLNKTRSWDSIVNKVWDRAFFQSEGFSKKLELNPYTYKMIHSIDFYEYGLEKIVDHRDFEFRKEKVVRVEEGSVQMVYTLTGTYAADHVFDSRVEWPEKDKNPLILQHFKGWFIRTKKPVFDPEAFTMMDFRLRWKDSCSFTYILPGSPTEALVEFTFFDREVVTEAVYERMLEKYLKEYLNLNKYEITSTERGVIPMTSTPFHEMSTDKVTKIGTAGSWVKPSTGYSFKHADRYVARLIENIKQGQRPDKNLLRPKYRWYDSLFIEVLYKHNKLGPKLFELMYKKNKVQSIFKFLDEETDLWEDVKIMNSFPKIPFLKALVGINN